MTTVHISFVSEYKLYLALQLSPVTHIDCACVSSRGHRLIAGGKGVSLCAESSGKNCVALFISCCCIVTPASYEHRDKAGLHDITAAQSNTAVLIRSSA